MYSFDPFFFYPCSVSSRRAVRSILIRNLTEYPPPPPPPPYEPARTPHGTPQGGGPPSTTPLDHIKKTVQPHRGTRCPFNIFLVVLDKSSGHASVGSIQEQHRTYTDTFRRFDIAQTRKMPLMGVERCSYGALTTLQASCTAVKLWRMH